MTTHVRVEHIGASMYTLVAQVQNFVSDDQSPGEWRDAEKIEIHGQTQLSELMLHSSRRVILTEVLKK